MTHLVRLPAVAAFLILAGCGRAPSLEDQVSVPPPTGPRPDSEQWDAVIQLYEMGKTQAVLEAEYLAVFELPGNSFTRMDTLEADFIDEEGNVGSHLTADSGEIYDQDREGNRRVKTWGGVVLVGSEGRTVRADTLWWDEADDRVFTDGPVEVTREGEILRGTGFESDSRLESMRLYRGSGVSQRGGDWLEEERRADEGARPDSTAVPADSLYQSARPDTTGIPP